ncbi:hypothetical protein SDC9_149612 [bioreactor metagenome]|uniref:Uncharacterized protein n=1 Tax=bioreactor metagenome TaxID=1076179 RepID=A0A645ELS7_9ZZZZ
MLVVIHQLAYGRLRARHDLDQIKPRFLGFFQRDAGAHHTQLLAFLANQAHLAVSNLFVNHRLVVDVHTPPCFFRDVVFLRAVWRRSKEKNAGQSTRRFTYLRGLVCRDLRKIFAR